MTGVWAPANTDQKKKHLLKKREPDGWRRVKQNERGFPVTKKNLTHTHTGGVTNSAWKRQQCVEPGPIRFPMQTGDHAGCLFISYIMVYPTFIPNPIRSFLFQPERPIAPDTSAPAVSRFANRRGGRITRYLSERKCRYTLCSGPERIVSTRCTGQCTAPVVQ